MGVSLTLVLSGMFIAYIAHSTWSLYNIYNPKQCEKGDLCIKPAWDKQSRFQFFFCTSRSNKVRSVEDLAPIWVEDDLDIFKSNEKELNVTLPRRTLKNGSLNAYVLLLERNVHHSPKTLEQAFDDPNVSFESGTLTKHIPPQDAEVNLIGMKGKDSTQATPKQKSPITHWKPKLDVNIMSDPFFFKARNVPAEIGHLIHLNSKRQYLPIVHMTDVTIREKDMIPVNASVPQMSLKIVINPISVGRLRLMISVGEAFKAMSSFGLATKDTDEVKGLFFDTNFYVLLLTLLVSGFHLLFDFLAFKNDVNFWRHKQSFVGLSLRGVVWRGASQVVIFLYLMDEDTSRIVLFTTGVGALIELWKVTKALKMSIYFEKWRLKVQFGDTSDEERKTDAYDSEGMKYLSWFLYPLCICGAIYSLMYQSHKSWYSWCIHSLANGVYAFGFLFMLPQLFLNYKLKSVAHLPWKVFMYKAFNTFIDDLFAFIITMPTAHRVACFRDDAIFLVYLYQRWLYPVDRTRVNEFGESFENSSKNKKHN
ncbi:lipid scramblase CLPTM1L-like [Ornithodoros turicata]|uniref:lipid scramblase CLPTM1L-like n=1 Tax=Ornithodoros turicata TaxID=34597 RepID=UPI00313A3D4C